MHKISAVGHTNPLLRLLSVARRGWLKYQLWNTEVTLESIDNERRRLEDDQRTAILLRAALMARLNGGPVRTATVHQFPIHRVKAAAVRAEAR